MVTASHHQVKEWRDQIEQDLLLQDAGCFVQDCLANEFRGLHFLLVKYLFCFYISMGVHMVYLACLYNC